MTTARAALTGSRQRHPRRPDRARSARRTLGRAEPVILGSLGIGIVVLLWQALASAEVVSPLLLASPQATAQALAEYLVTGEIWPHLAASGRLLFVGFAIAVVAGTALGVLAGWFTGLRAALAPHTALLYATPSVALMPLSIVWFGLGFSSQLAIVVLLAFFPCYFVGVDAVRTTDRSLIRVARSYGASDWRIFRSLVIPGSVPHILSGTRLAMGKAIVAVTVVELYASTQGLGYLLIVNGNRFKTAEVFAVIAIIAVFGLVSREVLRLLERRFDTWRVRP
jgi:NitT/TauT family transport system permease protein